MAEAAEAAAEVPEFHDSDLDALAGIEREAEPSQTEPAEPTGQESEGAGEPAVAGQKEVGQQQASGQPPTPQVSPTFKIKDKWYTPEQIAQNPELLRDLTQTYEQFPHLTRKQQELTETLRNIQAAQQQPQQPNRAQQPQSPPGSPGLAGFTPQQITSALAPVVKAAVDQGWMEGDLAEYFPSFAAQAVLHRDLIYDVRAAVAELQKWQRGFDSERTTTTTKAEFDAALDSVGSEGDVYGPLKTEKGAREAFTQYLLETVPGIDFNVVKNPEWIKRQWIAFNHEAIMESLKVAGQEAAARTSRKRSNATGESSTGRLSDAKGDEPFGADLLDSDEAKRIGLRK